MKDITEEIRDGMLMSSNPEVIKVAEKFMADNGFKRTVNGKMIACHEVAQWSTNNNAGAEFSTAVQAAIMGLPEDVDKSLHPELNSEIM